ncbi:MAG: ferrous iron transporter B [Clostridia bacterium]|nr:ferrous iron transporter B [Clostridia bacterium]
MKKLRIALAGNPNVGKSTVFNTLTGMKQHTGNWSGKTVDAACADMEYEDIKLEFIDLPGAYSLDTENNEEEVTGKFLLSGDYDAVIVICDATMPERNLILVLQVLSITKKAVVCFNMMDEAEKKGMQIDTDALSCMLQVPVVPCSARDGKGLDELIIKTVLTAKKEEEEITPPTLPRVTDETVEKAHELACAVVHYASEKQTKDNKADRILTGKYTAVPAMLCLLALVLFITIFAANYPSELLSELFGFLNAKLEILLQNIKLPSFLISLICDGLVKTVAWVVAVMLPPMAIFFPMFTLLEDVGYLPRIAFNLDRWYRKSGSCGKQALTTCMGFGCNAVGVTGCRIIESGRERTIAQLTNAFVPCNGKFPTLIAITSMFIAGGELWSYGVSAVVLCGLIVAGICMSFFVSTLLSHTLLRGTQSSFILELPPYRKPQFGKVIVNSLLNRTLFVLGRALVVAAPAGLIIWLMANVHAGGASILHHASVFLDVPGKILGMDGVMLLAFILGFPANEIVLPIALMAYTNAGSLIDISNMAALKDVLITNGWSIITAVCVMLFSLMHWPCSTTCLTVWKETHSIKKTLLAMALPTLCGIVVCSLISLGYRVFAALFL